MTENLPQLVVDSLVDEESLDDQEPSLPEQEPSLPDENPSLPEQESSLPDSLRSLLTDTNFDISVRELSLDDEESDAEEFPEPEPVFDVTTKTVKTGVKKGNVEKKVSLIIGNTIFKKRKTQKNGNIVFSCNGCQKEGLYLPALVGIEGKGYVDRHQRMMTDVQVHQDLPSIHTISQYQWAQYLQVYCF